MADQKVTYEVRLRDLMSKGLRTMGAQARRLATFMKTKFVQALRLARMALKGITIAAGATVAAVGGLAFVSARIGKNFLDAASDAEDAAAKFGTVFKGVEGDAQAMAEAIAADMGLGVATVQNAMGAVGDTVVPMGLARDQAAEFSAAVTMLTRDITSFNPRIRNMQQGLDAVTTSLVGSFRSARQFGVVLDQAKVDAEVLELGLVNLEFQIGQQDRAVATLSLFYKNLTDTLGDTNRTADSYKNTMIFLSEAIHDVKEEMGARLKLVLVEAVKQFGGVEKIVLFARLAFEFFTQVITELFIPAIIVAATNLAKFVEALGGTNEAVNFTGKNVKALAGAFVLALEGIGLGILLFANGITTIIAVIKEFMLAIEALIYLLARGFSFALELTLTALINFSEANAKAWERISSAVRDATAFVIDMLAGIVRSYGEAFLALNNVGLGDFFFDLGNDAIESARKIEAFALGVADISDAGAARGLRLMLEQMRQTVQVAGMDLDHTLDRIFRQMADVGTEFVDTIMGRDPAVDALLAALDEQSDSVEKDFQEIARLAAEAAAAMETIELATPEETDRAAALARIMERYTTLLDSVIEKQKLANQENLNLARTTENFGRAMDVTSQAAKGMVDGLISFTEDLPELQEMMADVTNNALVAFGNGLTDAFVSIIDGSKSAKQAFQDFASQLLIDIGRMIIQMLIFQAIAAGMGALGFGNTMLGGLAKGGLVEGGVGDMVPLANGGVVQGGLGRAMPVKGYANGGPIVDRPHIALIGEGRHNEAVVPLPDGRSIPVDMQGDGGGANVTVQISAVDAKSVDLLMRERKQTLVDIIQEAISSSRSFRSAVGNA